MQERAAAVATMDRARGDMPARATVKGPVRLAVVGCGAMVRENLLPVLAGHDRVRLVALVDLNEAATRSLADAYGVSNVFTSTASLDRSLVDAAIVATPPGLHAPQTVELARRGLHVFVEKPMAITAKDAEEMVSVADASGVTLAVGLYRRLLPSTRLLRGLMESGIVGAPIAIDVEEGGEYGWPLATLANLTPGLGGGGVLIDIGSHVLDVVQYLVPGAMEFVSYSDNARGGVETDAVLTARASGGSRPLPVRVALSRTRKLRNSIRVECERGVLELPRGEFAEVQIHFGDLKVKDALAAERPVRVATRWADEQPPIGYQAFRAEIDDWVDAMTLGREPVLSGRSGLSTVRLIADAYQAVRPIAEPWTDEGLAQTRQAAAVRRVSSYQRILITGASGFIGCRLAEVLSLRDGCSVRALVHDPSHAARLARLKVEMVSGDICSPADVEKAMAGCDAVVHCAVGTSWQRAEVTKVTVDGTRTLAEVAARLGVARFVHISSIAVHGRVSSPTLNEATPLVDAGEDNYGGDKRRAEDEVQKMVAQGLRAIILRPARVYGPYAKTFITRPVQHLVRGKLVLAGPVDGPSSMVYVDNVVEAIVRSLECGEDAIGKAFNVSDPNQLSWREFYAYFAERLGVELRVSPGVAAPVDAAPSNGFIANWRRGIGEVLASGEFRGFARKCVQTDPIGVLPRRIWEGVPAFRRTVQQALGMTDAVVYRPAAAEEGADLVFRTESSLVEFEEASRRLGYAPAVSRDRAMELTLLWAKHALLA